jgi:methylated-DNA-protein-cysteine methyltransferase-like protein
MWEQIYAVIQKLPAGYVATYGQIAALAGLPGFARQVGYALNALPENSPVPWHRVVNAKGKISIRSGGRGESRWNIFSGVLSGASMTP